ncbi:MAG: HAD-IC family P-type ATPase, partial [Emergencia sp.]|nr:HAD-IC family P-type ATPase [Emergencia sp.]
VEVKVISGDNPVTVSNVAMEAGIANADRYIDARQLVNERAIYEATERYTVFGRVTPEQKRMFVHALKKQGKTVGMTGDGVNDILALRDADCSIAMASGSEAASNAAQLVLMDSDFSKMPSVVAEGRRVVNNIEKTASLFLTKNIFSLLLALFSMISILAYPLKPSQITLISMFTIGMPSFILSLEPNRNKITGTFFGNVFKMAAPAGLTTFVSVSSLVVFGQVFEIDGDCISTSCTILVALVGFMILGKVAKPANAFHIGLITVMLVGMGYCLFFQREFFGIDEISTQAMMLLIVFLIATEGLFRYVYKFTSLCGRIIYGNPEKRRKKAKKDKKRIRIQITRQ